MATALFLRNTTANGIGSAYLDMVTRDGSAAATAVVDTTNAGTEIQWTQTAGGAVAQWISGRTPAGGFTLTSSNISIWAQESATQANCGGRFRVFKRTAGGTETELGGGPFNHGTEFTTSAAEYTWTGNVTDTAFAEDDRILLKVYITNVGSMGNGRTCTLTFGGASGATGDSFFNIAETVAFKVEAPAAGATVKHSGTWKAADTYVKHSGTWKIPATYVKHSGTWKQVVQAINPQFVASSSKRMTRTFGSNPTERKKCGISFWVSRSVLATTQNIFSGYDGSAANSSHVRFTVLADGSANQMRVVNAAGTYVVTTGGELSSIGIGVWRHIVISYDSTQATSTNRISIWVNGAFHNYGGTGPPAANEQHQFCMANGNNRIGSFWNDAGGFFLDAYLRDFHFIDGLTVTASQFAENIAGAWTAKTYAGSYGTNGFKLALGDTSVLPAAIGDDASGNNNDWTAVNF